MKTQNRFLLAAGLFTLGLGSVASVGCNSSNDETTCASSEQSFYEPPYLAPILNGDRTGDWDFDEHPLSDAGSCGHTEGQFYSVNFRIPKTGTYVAAVAEPGVDSVLSIRRVNPDLSCEAVLDCEEIDGAAAMGMAGAPSDGASDGAECEPIDLELGFGGAGSGGDRELGCFPTSIQVRAQLEVGDDVIVTLAHVSADESDGSGAIYFFEEEE